MEILDTSSKQCKIVIQDGKNKLSKYEYFKLQPKSQGELNFIFEEYRKHIEDSMR